MILGIDPGLNTTGYGLVRVAGTKLKIHEAGVIRTTTDESIGSRLEQIHTSMLELFQGETPCVMAVEQIHSTYRHPQTAILMGHARGVICLAAASHGVPIVSYRPTQVKKSLTGSGRADKSQMQRAIQIEFSLRESPKPADVADALALALCHYYLTRHVSASNSQMRY